MTKRRMTVADAMVQFRASLRRRRPKTAETYQVAILRLAEYLHEELGRPANRVLVREVNPDLIVGCIRWLAGSELAPASLRTYRTGISAFWRFLVLEGWVTMTAQEERRMQDRLRDILPRKSKRLPDIPSDEAFAALFAQARNAPGHTPRLALHKARNLAILETLRSTGCRASEMLGLTSADLDPERKAAMVRGKGEKDRLIFWDDRGWDAIQAYRSLLALHTGLGPTEPLFIRFDRPAPRDEPPRAMTYAAVRYMISRLCTEAGIQEGIRPHLFRHRFATKILGTTGNLAVTQDLLGHESPATTRRYARLTNDDLARARAAVGVV